MSGESNNAKEVGKQIGKAVSKIVNVTGAYYNIALSNIVSAYNGFTEETQESIFKNTEEDLDKCVEKELKEQNNKNKAEI